MQWFQIISHLSGLKSQGRHKFCKGGRKFSNGHYDLILLQIFFILISLNTKVPFILYTKLQPNIPSHSGEKVDFNGFAIFLRSIDAVVSEESQLNGLKSQGRRKLLTKTGGLTDGKPDAYVAHS